MKLSEELQWRGFVAENTLGDLSELDGEARKFYWGTDPNADSLHVGHLASLMMCACFVRHGYRPYLLVGGATGQIGDPKETSERDLVDLGEIERNKKALATQIKGLMRFDDLEMLDNLDWFAEVKFLEFLREVGKHFSMTQMLDRQFVQARIGEGGSGISYAEFSYTLIQGYDFLHLYRKYGIDLQLCGADQFGNCTSGIHLIRRLEGVRADAYACPLIIDKVTGRKFGKSEGNAVWLDEKKTSVFDFYQFWLNRADEAVEDDFKIYTLVEAGELAGIMKEHEAEPEKRLGQKRLAEAVTTVVHGAEKAASAAKITEVLFGEKDVAELSDAEVGMLEGFIPVAATDSTVVEALVETGVASSKSEARQLIGSGAVSVGGEKIGEDREIDGRAIIKKGKNKFILVK